MRELSSYIESCDVANKVLDVFIEKVIRISIHTTINKLDKEGEEHPGILYLPVSTLGVNKNDDLIESAFMILRL
ncbi:MAG: hypothetical protein ACTS85_03200 [Arsenophonus sp. NC-PG7-MAG3]